MLINYLLYDIGKEISSSLGRMRKQINLFLAEMLLTCSSVSFIISNSASVLQLERGLRIYLIISGTPVSEDIVITLISGVDKRHGWHYGLSSLYR